MNSIYYRWDRITDEVLPVPEREGGWAEFDKDRRVALTDVGRYTVSTVFLVIDHGFGRTPQLFETMVFNRHDEVEGFTHRYPTAALAREGHAKIVRKVKKLVLSEGPE